MNTIFELKIKNYAIKADFDACYLQHNDNVILKVSHSQLRAIAKWLISKVNQIKDSQEIKSLEQ